MKEIYIFGGGAVGMALAVHLVNSGREVRLIRTSGNALTKSTVDIVVEDLGIAHRATVHCSSITQIKKPDGFLVIATKAFANAALCTALRRTQAKGPIVLLQNGLSVERAFLEGGFPEIYRGVLYLTAQRESNTTVSFHPVKPSLIGVVSGTDDGLQSCVTALNSSAFPFEGSACIEAAVWQKAIVNCAFNSLCALLDADNGIFSREAGCMALAREVVCECVAVAERLGIRLVEQTIMDQIANISSGSNHIISTLQDIRNARSTEIAFLNLEVARLAASLEPKVPVPRTELLGNLIALKSKLTRDLPFAQQG